MAGGSVNAETRCSVLDKHVGEERSLIVTQEAQKQSSNERAIALQKGYGKRPFFYPIQPSGPYRLGGFCNGALVVYEMARQLRREGHVVDLLVLVDAIPARLKLFCRLVTWLGMLLRVGCDRQLTWFLRIQHIFRYVCDKNAEDFVYLRTIDARVDALFPPLETLRKEYPAMFTWATSQYKPLFYDGKVTLFWDEVEPVRRIWWRRMARKKDEEVEVHLLPGTHYTCKTVHPYGLAEHLRMCLSMVQS